MSQVQFSHNPLFCIDIIKTYKPDYLWLSAQNCLRKTIRNGLAGEAK